jgi:hypothetical protein
MGTWSISPDNDLVSIDSNGKLTYQKHTEDTEYTIKYQDDTCGTLTKTITIKKCEDCKYPDKTMDIKFYRASVPHYETFFALLDGNPSELLTDEAKEWIKANGYKFKSPTDITEDVYVGKYKYEGCVVKDFETECKACIISDGNFRTEKLVVGKGYFYCTYNEATDKWGYPISSLHNRQMPTAEYAQEHYRTDLDCCFVIYT